MAKVKYVARSLERHVLAPREHTWSVLLAELERTRPLAGPGDGLVETVLSFESPWRRCSKLEGDATNLDHYEGTFVIRDDGPECHVSWGVVVDPEPSEAGWAFLELAIATIDGFLDQVKAAAEA